MTISGEVITCQWSLLPDACHSKSVLMVCSHHFHLPQNTVTEMARTYHILGADWFFPTTKCEICPDIVTTFAVS